MTDIRARLADALREHRNCPWSHVKDESETWEDHVVDMLLSLDGIAIVELPATFIDQTKVNKVRDELKWIHKALEDARQWRDWEEVARLRTRVSHAVALLAAANAAESHTQPRNGPA